MPKRKKPFADDGLGKPVPKKRAEKKNPLDKEEIDDEEQNFRTIKCALKSIVKPPYREYLKEIFFQRSILMTEISSLASLLLLYKVNTAIDANDRLFFENNGDELIKDTFNAVLINNINDATKMPPGFRQMVEENIGDPNFVWPSKTLLGNGFNYFITTYKTSVKNNLVTHCQTRIRYWLRMVCYEWNRNGLEYDDTDIRNTIKALFQNQDWTDGDQNRLEKLHSLRNTVIQLGFPAEQWLYFKAYVKHNWLRSMWMFATIQRIVEQFLIQHNELIQQWHIYNKDKKNNEKPSEPMPPTVRNFTVVPLCRFQLKHVRLDHTDIFQITSNAGKIREKVFNNKTGNWIKPRKSAYNNRKEKLWEMMFNMKKIKRIAKKNKQKHFHFQLLTDSVSASLLFKKPKQGKPIDQKEVERMIRQKYEDGSYVNEIGIDPGDKTYIAAVVRQIQTGKETNLKIANPRYHWDAKQGIRDRKAKIFTEQYTLIEQHDLASYESIPSPRGSTWENYIRHRIKMLHDGMATYARRKYARLHFDQYVESNRANDKIAKKITNNQPSIIYLGGAELAPNRPIGIKRYKRCPGTRKSLISFKKLGHSDVDIVDEKYTSLTCANCYKRFPLYMRYHRFKVCRRCRAVRRGDPEIDPNTDRNSNLPYKIVTQHSKRNLQVARFIEQTVADIENRPANYPLVPKVKICRKNWPLIDIDAAEDYQDWRTVVWHRDIVAAKCILYKGESTSSLLKSSPIKKGNQKPEEEENDLFKLPPMQEDLPKDESLTDITESDDSFDERQRNVYNHNLKAIDVKSSHFQSLPADIRHEILTDIKETRKQSSWGRLHELPVESQSFSCFQMSRLLKRRQVQVELEEAEREMGGKGGLSMAELENLLSEEGVVDPDIANERIASNEHVRFLHVRDITKAIKKETDEKVKKEKLHDIKEEPDEKVVNESDGMKAVNEIIKTEMLTKEDIDLQKAIQLSMLAVNPDDVYVEGEENDNVRLTVEQRKALGSAANSLARHYMVEYGGLNDEEVSDLVKLDESVNVTQEFKYNDESVLVGKTMSADIPSTSQKTSLNFQGKEIKKMLNWESEKTVNMSESSSDEDEVSSNADSDFIDVPEMDSEMDHDDTFFMRSKFPLPPPFLMNPPPVNNTENTASNDTKLEVVINPGQMCTIQDDIFADIFENTEPSKSDTAHVENSVSKIEEQNGKANEIKQIEQIEVIEEAKSVDSFEEVEIVKTAEVEKCDDEVEKIQDKSDESIESDTKSPEKEKSPAVIASGPFKKSSESKIQSILSGLDNQISAVTKLSLDDLLGPKDTSGENITDTKKGDDYLNIMEKEPQSIEITTPTKIPQPFFIKKTPPSSKKKSPGSVKNEHDTKQTKVSKSLLEAFDSIPSTSTNVVSEKDSIEMAASVLRDNKTKEELEDMADLLNKERRDLAAERNKKDRLGVSITEQMSMECMELLRLFGVPYVVAPMEAEAQCAYLNEIKLTDGTITDDSDIWLFGGQTVYKNFFDQNKHVMEFKSDNIQRLFHLDRHKLIQLSFLVGSDYTEGIHGVGAVTALEVLSIFTATPEKEGETTQMMSILSSLRKFRDWWFNKSAAQRANTLRNKLKNITITEDFPNDRVVEAYLYPTVDENREHFSWGKPEVESIREYAKKTFGWTNKRTDEIIMPVVKRLNEKTSQQSIQNYFKITDITSRQDLKVSKRVRAALQHMSGDPDSSFMEEDEVVEKKKTRKKPAKKAAKKVTNDESAETSADVDGVVVIPDSQPETEAKPVPQVEEPVEIKSKAKAKPKPTNDKPKRKRKAPQPVELNANSDTEASASTTINASIGIKKIVLPDNNAPIPQREKDKEIAESNRLKAIEVMKKAKLGKKK